MYLYFYDSIAQQKKFRHELQRIESRLMDLGINGRIEKCSILKNAKEMVEDGIKQGATTVVGVGNDATFRLLVRLTALKNVTLGFIPLQSSRFATILGLPQGADACDVLSKRMTATIDLGKIQQTVFCMSLEFPEGGVKIECDDQYRVMPSIPESRVCIANLGNILDRRPLERQMMSNPTDGRLEAIVYEPNSVSRFPFWSGDRPVQRSVFPGKKFRIESLSKESKVVVDDERVLKTPLTVEILPQRLRLIVGKDRFF